MSLASIDLTYGRGPGAVAALRDVTLEVPAASLLAILGPSGCGKTSLLRVVAGLERPARGAIRFDGADAAEVPAHLRRAGFVFASDALFPHLSARANIAYGVRRDARRRVAEAAALCRVGDVLERRPSELSGGQRQRVALARALASDPRVLLLDEPFSRLDAPLRLELRREVARIQRETAVTTIVVTHDQAEALALGDRVAVMRAGRVEQLATPRALVREPATSFVAGFVGSPPMALVAPRALGIAGAPGTLAGVRAADVRLGAAGAFAGVVLDVEEDADRTLVRLDLGEQTLVALVREPDVPPAPGDRVRFDVAAERVALFGSEGARLGPKTAPEREPAPGV